MLAIKLQRIGRKHQPSYRVVVAEKRSKMGAPPVEDFGSYNSFDKTFAVNAERVSYWLKAGARPTATVHNLLVKNGILVVPKLKIAIKKKQAGESTPALAGIGVSPEDKLEPAVASAAEEITPVSN